MINSFISLVVHIILVLVLLEFTNLGIFSLVIGNASFPVIIFVLNLIALYKDEGYRLPVTLQDGETIGFSADKIVYTFDI